VVNVISWNMAYSLFPDATFCKRKCYALKSWSEKLNPRRDTYTKRGWEIVVEPHCGRSITGWPTSIVRREYRSPGDSSTWRIRLDTTGVTEGMPLSVFKYCFFHVIRWSEFQLAGHAGRPRNRPHYYIIAGDFESSVLKYVYTYPARGWWESSGRPSTDFWASISHFTDQLSSYAFSELDHHSKRAILGTTDIRWSPFDVYFHDQPSLLWHVAKQIRTDPPPGWVFLDDQIESWFAKWLQHRSMQEVGDKETYFSILRRYCKTKERIIARARLTRGSISPFIASII
jgi:hypothetical protein